MAGATQGACPQGARTVHAALPSAPGVSGAARPVSGGSSPAGASLGNLSRSREKMRIVALGTPRNGPLASPSKMTRHRSSAANRPGSPSLNRSRKEGPLDVGKRPLALDTGVKAHGTEQPGAQTARGESGKSGAGQRRRVARPGETG